MCGFVAFIQNTPEVNLDTARRVLQTLTHRGPNAGGEWREGEVMLLHRRLSIIDLATGDQPMRSGDNRYVIVFNGEIYNYFELRDQLACEALLRTRYIEGDPPDSGEPIVSAIRWRRDTRPSEKSRSPQPF